MTSPPRRMTRARAKKEGYQPDARINPNWKTPRKTKTRFVLPDNDNTGDNENPVKTGSIMGAAQRAPSPVKIRIPPKLPPQPHVGSSSAGMATQPEGTSPLNASVSSRTSVLGSPVRVR